MSFPSDEELLNYGVTPHELADPSYVRAVPLAPSVDMFDAEFFGMSPRDAEICDPQLRIFLEVAHATIEDAGYDVTRIGEGMGVFGATGPARYADMYVLRNERYAREPLNLWTLNNVDYLSTLVSYKLNLRGPSFTMATACSSSLVAVHLACQALRVGECDVALAGGSTVNLPYGHGHFWAPGGVKSPDGHCRPFDVSGGGTTFGNGAAAVLLKRLPDAVADGDHVYAVIKGSAINNDGADKLSFSAPSVTGQSIAIMEAMSLAGLRPSDLSYVEAHGTGTALGDPVEVAALTAAYRRLEPELPSPGSIMIGSVKSNVGHLVWAAGVASLIKVALAMGHEKLPPNINFTGPNPSIDFPNTPFAVAETLQDWRYRPDAPRRAGISSLGIGGTNAHLVVEEGIRRASASAETRPRIVLWSAKNTEAVTAVRGELAEYFADHGEEDFTDAVATLQRGRTAYPIREALVCTSAVQAGEQMAEGGVMGPRTGRSAASTATRVAAFLFPGQGSQHPRMAAGLYGRQRRFTQTMDLCLEAFEREGIELYDQWLADGESAELEQTSLAQPLLFAVEYALAATWLSWGVQPVALLGHSVGELVAATVAGVFTWEEGVRLVAARAQAMQAMEPGAMLALRLPEREARELLSGAVSVAVVNSATQTVVAGPRGEVSDLAERLRAGGVSTSLLRTSHAFHTPAMAEAVPRFLAAFDGIKPREPELAVYSAATGRLLTAEEAADPGFWAQQIVEPVRFGPALEALATAHEGFLLEVGPGRTVTSLAHGLPHVGIRAVASLPDGEHGDEHGDERQLLSAVARLWVEGVTVDWEAFSDAEPVQRIPLPTYQFQRQRHWVEPSTGPAAPRRADGSLKSGAEEGPMWRPAGNVEQADVPAERATELQQATPFSVLTWTEQLRSAAGPGAVPESRPLAVALLPREPNAALPLVAALQQAGHRVVRVRQGEEFRVLGDEIWARHDPADMGLLVEELERTGRWPGLLVLGWGAENWPAPNADTVAEQLNRAFHAPLALLQRFGRSSGGLPDVMALMTRSVDVTGGEPVDPVKAATHGLVATLALESPEVDCRIVDIGPGTEDDLIEEILLPHCPPLVALRGSRRWERRERPVTFPERPGPLRRQGVYLITGGLGGLGLAVAKGLAQTGKRPRLILLGRTGAADAAVIDELQRLGAQVKVVGCDVADRRALNRELDIATARFGQINGVFHLAGVPGDGMLQFRDAEQAAAVLHPKVRGSLVLEEVLTDRPPVDFLVSFSSRAALAGMVGSGDYAAGNAFLDAWSGQARPDGVRRLAIDWPAWTDVGMAAPTAPAHQDDAEPGDLIFATEVSAEDCWALDEHRFGGTAVLPGAGLLDLVIRAFRKTVDDSADAPIVLEEVVFERPLSGEGVREVQVVFSPHGEGHAIRVLSRPRGVAGSWIRHVTGHIGRLETADPPERRDLAALRAGVPKVTPPSFTPKPNEFLTLGPRWQGLKRMWATDDTKLVHMRLPEACLGDLAEYPLHPALLDLATALVRDPDKDRSHLPFLYGRLVLYGDLPAELYSHIRRRPDAEGVIVGDIELLTPDGMVLAEITGFTMRLLKDRGFAERADGPDTSGTATAAEPTKGLDPDTGVRLLMTLLAARTPAEVVVRPYSDGRPTPINDLLAADAILPPTVPDQPLRPDAPRPRAPRPVPDQTMPDPAAERVADSVEGKLLKMWREAIGRADIGREDDFFEIGGDSLSAVQLMTQIREEFGVNLSIGILFDQPTLAELCGVVKDRLER